MFAEHIRAQPRSNKTRKAPVRGRLAALWPCGVRARGREEGTTHDEQHGREEVHGLAVSNARVEGGVCQQHVPIFWVAQHTAATRESEKLAASKAQHSLSPQPRASDRCFVLANKAPPATQQQTSVHTQRGQGVGGAPQGSLAGIAVNVGMPREGTTQVKLNHLHRFTQRRDIFVPTTAIVVAAAAAACHVATHPRSDGAIGSSAVRAGAASRLRRTS